MATDTSEFMLCRAFLLGVFISEDTDDPSLFIKQHNGLQALKHIVDGNLTLQESPLDQPNETLTQGLENELTNLSVRMDRDIAKSILNAFASVGMTPD